MPPRGRGRGGKTMVPPAPAAAPVDPPELRGLEQHGRNADHYVKVMAWRQTIEAHPLFHNICQEMPLSIKDAGTQQPFNDADFNIAIGRCGGEVAYTAGINLFWCDALYSPTPGIPVRSETIPDLMECYFKAPAHMPHTIAISLQPGERPLDKRGALVAINPEEIRHAMMGAIARDIETNVATEVLEQWRVRVLSCTGSFSVHTTEAGRLQASMQLRENFANDHEAMSRTQLQRIYEIIYFRDVHARTNGRDQATAANIAAEYAKVRMAKGREKISKSFVDTALTIHARLLAIPAAECLLLEMDSSLPRDANPFNSVHRLQAIVSKCGNSRENTLWVLRHVHHMVMNHKTDPASTDFTVEGLRGSTKSGNRGLVDVILLKKEAIGHLCHKLPIQLGIEGDANWLSDLRAGLKDHNSFLASRQGEGLTWRNRLTPAQSRYVAFAEDLLYGTRHDHHLKALVRASKTVAAIEGFPGLSEALDDVKSLLATEEQEERKAEVEAVTTEVTMKDVVLKIHADHDKASKDKKDDAKEIKLADLGDEEKAEWLRSREFLKQQIHNYVHILVIDEVPGDLTEAILDTPAGRFEGGSKQGGRTKFVGVVWDSRVMGESSARPSIRMPPLQIAEVHRLLESIRARHDRAPADESANKLLHPFDLYISLSGGRDMGSQYQRFFQATGPPAPTTRLVHVFLDPVSVQERFERVRGIASNRTHDTMRLTAAPWPRQDLKTTPRIKYRGTSASDSIGPVVLSQTNDEETWMLTWAQKKMLYGTRGLIAVGGRGDIVDDGPEDDDAPADEAASTVAATRRTDDTQEMAFYHALPSSFWEEVVYDYQLGAILDLACGDGALALTALRNRIPYTGLAFTTYRKDMIMSRLLDLLSAGALKAGDKWYDPSLVKTLMQAAKKKKPEDDGGEPPKKKQKQNKGKQDDDDDNTHTEPKEAKTQKTKKGKPNSKKKGKNPKRTAADSGSNMESNVSVGSEEGSERDSDWD